ncbi:MAG TPA: hypothetical protein VEQ18_02120 [Candidatus Nitrosocosmicus sp.]|nr:hypothetical protein [Candidatus Nitrosocosmicus sp.]
MVRLRRSGPLDAAESFPPSDLKAIDIGNEVGNMRSFRTMDDRQASSVNAETRPLKPTEAHPWGLFEAQGENTFFKFFIIF